MDLCFAYGSNLDQRQMRRRCPGSRPEARAVLRDHALRFGGHSVRWGGAVAGLVREDGARVEGLLYRVGREDLQRLDGYEGHPHVYRRETRTVIDETGRRRRAEVYLLPEGFSEGAPAAGYLSTIRRAYARLGFDASPLDRAAGGRMETTRIFVYGTLRQGGSNERVIQDLGDCAHFVGPARTVRGFELRDLGAFPAMIPGCGVVEGEIVEVDAAGLARLDRFEGHPSFYQRGEVELEGGEVAQAYMMTGERTAGRPIIASGDWLAHWRRS